MPINCYLTNRDTLPVCGMVEFLLRCEGVGRVIILDCASTYEPLLEWYRKECPAEVLLCENLGNHAVWNRGEVLGEPGDECYFASDSDLDLTGIPLDCLLRMQEGLKRYPDAIKASFSLRLDDIPPDNPLLPHIHGYEDKCWIKRLDPDWYEGPIDTVGAMYRVGTGWGGYAPGIRMAPPYVARHLSWYLTEENMTPDWRHYLTHLNPQGIVWGPDLKQRFHL